jgi:hypothetical protein
MGRMGRNGPDHSAGVRPRIIQGTYVDTTGTLTMGTPGSIGGRNRCDSIRFDRI